MTRLKKLLIVVLSVLSFTVVAVSPAAAVAPDPPTGVTASAITSTSMTVEWTAPVAGDPVVDYTLSLSPADDGPFTVGGLSQAVTGLTPGTVYTLSVTANNGDGSSVAGVGPAVTLSAETSEPTSFSAGAGTPTHTAVDLSWGAPTTINGSAVTSYEITSTPAIPSTTPGAAATTQTLTGLTPGTLYSFEIVAVNAIGDSAPATATITTAAAPTAPGPVTSPSITLNGASPDTAFLVDWALPASGDAPTSYSVAIPGIGGSPFTVTAPTTQLAVTGATAGTSYTATIVATNAVGSSAGVTASDTTATVPDAPAKPTATSASATSVLVSWVSPAANSSAITGYVVTASPGGATAASAGNSATVTGLTPGQNYTFTVVATNAVGAGSASPASDAVAPIAVTSAPNSVGISFDVNTLNAVTVTWAAPTTTNGSAVQEYIVQVTKSGGSTVTASPNPGAGATSILISGLEAGSYTAKVIAVNAAGQSPAGDSAGSVNVLAAPGAVTNFVTTLVTPGNVAEITWDPPTDDGGDTVASYTISMAGQTATVPATSTSVRLGPLPGGSYSATIHANTSAGPGPSLTSNTVKVYGFPPFFSEDNFIKQQYRDFLGREAEASGVTYWKTQTADDASNVTSVITRFMDSNEFAPRRAVARLYLAYFDRDPDEAGFDFWTKQIATGNGTIESASQFFASGPEFQAKYGTLSNREFVELVYKNVLGRDGEKSGVDFWTARVDAGLDRGSMMTFFSESPENRTRTNAEVLVIVTYRGMLDRAPDDAGRAFWINAVQGDANALASLIHGFYHSPEYAGRVTP